MASFIPSASSHSPTCVSQEDGQSSTDHVSDSNAKTLAEVINTQTNTAKLYTLIAKCKIIRKQASNRNIDQEDPSKITFTLL